MGSCWCVGVEARSSAGIDGFRGRGQGEGGEQGAPEIAAPRQPDVIPTVLKWQAGSLSLLSLSVSLPFFFFFFFFLGWSSRLHGGGMRRAGVAGCVWPSASATRPGSPVACRGAAMVSPQHGLSPACDRNHEAWGGANDGSLSHHEPTAIS